MLTGLKGALVQCSPDGLRNVSVAKKRTLLTKHHLLALTSYPLCNQPRAILGVSHIQNGQNQEVAVLDIISATTHYVHTASTNVEEGYFPSLPFAFLFFTFFDSPPIQAFSLN